MLYDILQQIHNKNILFYDLKFWTYKEYLFQVVLIFSLKATCDSTCSAWSSWQDSDCSQSCDEGRMERHRNRTCVHDDCTTTDETSTSCNIKVCSGKYKLFSIFNICVICEFKGNPRRIVMIWMKIFFFKFLKDKGRLGFSFSQFVYTVYLLFASFLLHLYFSSSFLYMF